MKKEARQIYIELAREIDWNICGFCRYNRCSSSICEDGYSECEHPLWQVADNADNVDSAGCDCWGFSPWVNARDCADIVGIILAAGWDTERSMWWKDEKQIKVSGMPRLLKER